MLPEQNKKLKHILSNLDSIMCDPAGDASIACASSEDLSTLNRVLRDLRSLVDEPIEEEFFTVQMAALHTGWELEFILRPMLCLKVRSTRLNWVAEYCISTLQPLTEQKKMLIEFLKHTSHTDIEEIKNGG